MSDSHAFDAKSTVRRFVIVGLVLYTFTIITVAVSYLHLETPEAILVAMLIAVFKGTMVALYFMHLIDERKVIYYSLALSVIFFGVMVFLPLLAHSDQQGMLPLLK